MSCVLSSVDGESDPRNLLVVFDLLNFMLITFCQQNSTIEQDSLQPHLLDIFDKLSCYFPINFKPPKDDRFKITPEELQLKLKNCFLACDSIELLENAFPFLLEKMSS